MTILYAILAIILLVLILAIFTKKGYTIVQEITINQPDAIVYEHLRFLKNHKQFNAWFLKDSNRTESS